MDLNLQVEKRDVVEAFRLLDVAMQQSATDHSTGTLSFPILILDMLCMLLLLCCIYHDWIC